ncbi:hypothetical protein [Hymenobacter latericus]|uniref:hypothetical protein n=1 Tax=Hymenobacter sp. YIM 151858-1 TaxID=2987688 RepID=UPI002226A8A7|nr:hypothetical protein [Hymenobacter sp. YIM 151858-1]UYZ60079.1 hypothetical protein OIS50_04585 [Hymenobacter sp. YIM 151858-1]
MKKRLRKKLGVGEYANPYRKTRKQREHEAKLRAAFQALPKSFWDKLFSQLDTANEA